MLKILSANVQLPSTMEKFHKLWWDVVKRPDNPMNEMETKFMQAISSNPSRPLSERELLAFNRLWDIYGEKERPKDSEETWCPVCDYELPHHAPGCKFTDLQVF